MCSYCGCRATPEIDALMTQHEGIVNAAGELARSVSAGADGPVVAQRLDAVAEILAAHVLREETGLFAGVRDTAEFGPHVAHLCDEHDEIDALVAAVRDGDQAAVEPLVDLLRDHIDREDNGLFPAVAIALDGAAWAGVAQRVAAG